MRLPQLRGSGGCLKRDGDMVTRQTGKLANGHVHHRNCRLVVASSQPKSGFMSGLTRLFGKDVSSQAPPAPTVRVAESGGIDELELPPYTVVRRAKGYALRLYDVHPVVEMPYERREQGYATLGGYFDGANAEGARFAYTQPVVMTYNADGSKKMHMHIGSRHGAASASSSSGGSTAQVLASLPAPTDVGVSLSVTGGELVAVAQFDGFITPATANTMRQALLQALKRDGIEVADEDASGRFRVGQYGAVYSLAGRLNEMMLRVKA